MMVDEENLESPRLAKGPKSDANLIDFVGAGSFGVPSHGQPISVSRFPLPQKQKIPPSSQKRKIIVLSGPTAVGKSHLALCIAQAIGGEIISADSMQVYRGMDIGTAKVTSEERRLVPHHLIDSRDLDETFNVVEFYREATQAIDEIFAKGKIPIVVGGTGFYIHALLYGPPSGPPSVPELRQKLEEEMELRGAEPLYDRLKTIDPDYAATITQRDRHKIIRALEIVTLTQQKVSALPTGSSENTELYDFRCWFIHIPKEILYPKIEQRCDQMLAKGFLEEVIGLEAQGLRQNLTACQAIGYRQCLDFLETVRGPDDWARFVHEFKQASRRYAKRQFTWFRREPFFRWLNIDKMPVDTVAEVIIQDFETSF